MRQPAQQHTHRARGVGPSPTGEGLVSCLAGSIHISCSAGCAVQVGLPSAGVDDWQGLALLRVMELVVNEDLVAKEQAKCQTPSELIAIGQACWLLHCKCLLRGMPEAGCLRQCKAEVCA